MAFEKARRLRSGEAWSEELSPHDGGFLCFLEEYSRKSPRRSREETAGGLTSPVLGSQGKDGMGLLAEKLAWNGKFPCKTADEG